MLRPCKGATCEFMKSNLKRAGQPDLTVTVAGIAMQNPVMTASGTFGYAKEYHAYLDLSRLGPNVVKTITLLPRASSITSAICPSREATTQQPAAMYSKSLIGEK